MFRSFVLAILFVASSAQAQALKKGEIYPVEERRLFMRGCLNNDVRMQDFCVCVLRKFQSAMTFKEFTAMNDLSDEQLSKHKPYASAIISCAKDRESRISSD